MEEPLHQSLLKYTLGVCGGLYLALSSDKWLAVPIVVALGWVSRSAGRLQERTLRPVLPPAVGQNREDSNHDVERPETTGRGGIVRMVAGQVFRQRYENVPPAASPHTPGGHLVNSAFPTNTAPSEDVD